MLNDYLTDIIDICKGDGSESANLGENAVNAQEARRALVRLKVRMKQAEAAGKNWN